jgi:hypothetical protein
MEYTKALQDESLLHASDQPQPTDLATTVRERGGEALVTQLPHIHCGSVEIRPFVEAAPSQATDQAAATQA